MVPKLRARKKKRKEKNIRSLQLYLESRLPACPPLFISLSFFFLLFLFPRKQLDREINFTWQSSNYRHFRSANETSANNTKSANVQISDVAGEKRNGEIKRVKKENQEK